MLQIEGSQAWDRTVYSITPVAELHISIVFTVHPINISPTLHMSDKDEAQTVVARDVVVIHEHVKHYLNVLRDNVGWARELQAQMQIPV